MVSSPQDAPTPIKSSALPRDLESLGWDASLAARFMELAAPGCVPARVIAEHRSRYLVHTGTAERDAVLAGRFRHDMPEAAWPTVGDWVALGDASEAGDGIRAIHALIPRTTAFVRKAAFVDAPQVVAANVDIVCVVAPLVPAINVRAIERYVALAWESGAVPLIVLTKRDLCSGEEAHAAITSVRAVAPGVDVLALSAETGEGIDLLEGYLPRGRTTVLLGPSGAGKSTLVNRLVGLERMATGAVRDDGKGRHTTTHRELVRLSSGALLIDTPGMRELGLWVGGEGLEAAFADVEALASACRFRDCAHDAEPGCAVREAVDAGRLPADRLAAWHKLRRELAQLAARSDPEAAAEARAHTRAIHRAFEKFLRQRGR